MTWTVTHQESVPAAAGSSNITIASFTPPADSLLVVFSTCSNDGDVSGITGHGTWSNVDRQEWAAQNVTADIWACRVGSSPSAAALTIARGYTFRHAVSAIIIESTNGIAGSTVGDAFGTASTLVEGTNPSTLTGTLSAFAQSSNLTLGFGFKRNTFSGTRWSPSTDYTELNEWATGGSNFSNATVYYAGEDTSPSIEVASDPSIDAAFIAIEVKEAAAAGGGSANTLTLLGVG